MKKALRYSVLRYSPSKVSGEKINLGIIFVDEAQGIHEFRHTSRFKRIATFDDEISIDNVKKLLKGIKLDVNNSPLTNGKFNLDSYIQFFINDFYFDEPKTIYYNNWEDAVERINKSYFRFDYEKNDRPSKADDLRLIGDIISEKSQEVKKQHKIEGFFNEKVTYDFVTEKYKIKIMDFDDKNLSKLINNAKSWAMTCMTDPEKNVLVIYRYSNSDNMENNMEFESIKEIFDYAGANFVNIEEGVSLICNRVRA